MHPCPRPDVCVWPAASSTTGGPCVVPAGQRAQVWGQSLGLPTTMTLFALLSVLVTSGSQAVYGEAIWDPVQLVARTDNVFGLLYALVTVLIATISVNIASNVVSPAYDLANLAPKVINFRTGALITGVVGVLIMPWKLTETPELYIFTCARPGRRSARYGRGHPDRRLLDRPPHCPRPRRPLPPRRPLLVHAGLELARRRGLRRRRHPCDRRLPLGPPARARSRRTA